MGEFRVGLVGVAIDQRAGIKRVGHRPHLVLELEQGFPAIYIDNILEAILILIAFLGDQAAFDQAGMRAGKVGEVNLDMVAIVFR